MAPPNKGNPQVEDGYTKIANELLEALVMNRIPGEQMQCLLHIFRMTYGWGKVSSEISNSDFVVSTGLKKQHVCRALKELEKKKIVVTKYGDKKSANYRINKKYGGWNLSPKKVTVTKKGYNCNQKRLQVPILPLVERKKEREPFVAPVGATECSSEISHRKKKQKFADDSLGYRIANYLYKHILERKPDFKRPNFQTWAVEADRMIRIDGRDVETIKAVIKWAQTNSFWQSNILSTKKLREQFDALHDKMNGEICKSANSGLSSEFLKGEW